ncbi:helix-turn-helix transcriptional regulator [Lentzea tibetensis]|uniref:Helix-turn-helix transcriptional regulator n=1 Tax=Lentzea tibetensis TaxID=2591470 RepID=A0A563EV03_9PSEU|nr:helix-turn-helix transcriptional regulator [Lentzea tibetensis]TWP51483.1 helix-turn-helix transcriptional regulator [Lentzea tibetensis]
MRCWCTGETVNMVRRQRKQFGKTGGQLVPAARTAGQQALEAALLLAVNRTMAGMRRRGHPLRPTAVVGRVHLGSPVLALEVDPVVVELLLGQALPLRAGDELIGIRGLRPVPGRDHLDLVGRHGAVRLLGVTKNVWRDALDRIGTPVESTAEPPAGPVKLMSGVLRRLPLWKGAAWLDVVPSNDSLEIYWRGGPSSWSMAEILSGSSAALPKVSASPHDMSDVVRGVALSDVKVGRGTGAEPERAWMEWVIATFPGPALNEHAVRSDHVELLPGGWEHDDMRTALARRDVGAVYRLLERRGVARERIGELTGQSPVEVAAIAGGRRVESYELLSRIANGLGVPRGYMGLAFDEEVPACDCADDETAKRRRFLQHAAAVTVGFAVFGEYSGNWGPCSCELTARRRAISA